MCGIAGFADGYISSSEARSTIDRMLSSISHRGPDARDVYQHENVCLGHNRLSIIDLSPEGNQPMRFQDLVIVYNGEIYNYIEIKEELISRGVHFKTNSDTEVILAAYKTYGRNCVNKFIGMWAFAIYDETAGELFCSRDRFGIKPFYYLLDGSRFYFGSEIKALKASPIFHNDVNLGQIGRGLQLGWVCFKDETYFESVKSLEAASNLVFKNGEITIQKYWELNDRSEKELSPSEAIHVFREMLQESISQHLRSDVEIAICLSGGIDSSSLTGLIKEQYPGKEFKTYSIYYDGPGEVDERPFINAVNSKVGGLVPFQYRPSEGEIQSMFHDIMYHVEVPASGSSNFSHFFLIKKIHEMGIKVVVDGQGADEYLGGYMHSMYRYQADLIRRFKIVSLIKNLSANYSRQDQKLSELLAYIGKTFLSLIMDERSLYQFEYKNYYPYVIKNGVDSGLENLDQSPFKDKLNGFLYQLLSVSSLPTILHYVDKMTMAHSVESRVPLLDHRLVEFAFTLPNELKINKATTKYVLREAVKDLLPPMVYQRRDKKGFVTPGEVKWLRGPMRECLNLDYGLLEFLQKEKVQGIISNYLNGDNSNAKLVWRLMTLNYWMKNFV